MLADDFIADGYGPHVFKIVNFNYTCRADICAGGAADAKSLDGCDIIHPISFLHLKGPGSDDFIADPDTQTTANTPIGRWPRVYIIGPGKLNDGFGLGRHLQQAFESPGSCTVNGLSPGF
jgi:hypothetical protein